MRKNEGRNVHGSTAFIRDAHDHLNYERGAVSHSRNPHNQMLNFHFGYGGLYNYFVKRWLYQHAYKKFFRIVWIPATVWFFFGWAGMRSYDNAVYDYYYFFDAKDGGHH